MGFKKLRMLFVCLASCSVAIPAVSIAGAESGFYIGAGVGDATVKADDINFDESDAAYKIFGGYNIGFIPLVDFAVEASYVDFGSPNSGLNRMDINGVNAFGLAGLSFGPFGLFAKAGAIRWDLDASGSDGNGGIVSGSQSGTDPAYGIGARFAISSFAVRAEYEVYDVDSVSDLSMLSVSAVFTF